MVKPVTLTDKILVLADEKQVLCIYPYRDSDYTKITGQTRNMLIVGYGAQETAEQQLTEAIETTLAYVKLVSSGETEIIKVFSSTPK
jgi:DNA/RNA-binding domain of Phe-tRNA-synthetase-like protein